MEGTEKDLAKIQEIGPILDETKVIQKQTRWIRLGFLLLAILVVVLWSWTIVNHFRNFNIDDLGGEIAERAESTWPMIAGELDKMVANVVPAAEAAFLKELDKAADQIEAKFNSEAELLEENLRKNVEDTMKRFLNPQLRTVAVKDLQEAFPEFNDEKKVDELAEQLQSAFVMETQTQILSMVTQYYDAILNFNKAFKTLEKDGSASGRPASLEAVLEMWIELIYEKMGGDGESENTGKSKPKKQNG